MNLILFEEHELGQALPRRDERTEHLVKVLRKKAGDYFEAGLLGGKKGLGRIERIASDGSLELSLRLTGDAPPRVPIRVAVGFPRPIQLKRLLRDLSSMGLVAVDLVETELGEKSYRDAGLLKDGGARRALVEGAVQARDTRIPELALYPGVEAWLREHPWEKDLLPGDGGRGNRPPFLAALDNKRPEGSLTDIDPGRRSAALVVGSERGWSDAEREKLEAAGFSRLSIGPRPLRVETACVAASILVMEKIGEL